MHVTVFPLLFDCPECCYQARPGQASMVRHAVRIIAMAPANGVQQKQQQQPQSVEKQHIAAPCK